MGTVEFLIHLVLTVSIFIFTILEIYLIWQLYKILHIKKEKESLKYIKRCSMCKNLLPVDVYYSKCPYCGKDLKGEIDKHARKVHDR